MHPGTGKIQMVMVAAPLNPGDSLQIPAVPLLLSFL